LLFLIVNLCSFNIYKIPSSAILICGALSQSQVV
jgi:hypothetical protein